MTDEKASWEQQEDEPNRWFQRFSAFRLMGPGRGLLETINQEKVQKGQRKSKYPPGSWRDAAEKWQWRTRANAWDKDVIAQADLKWRAEIMGEAELLARLSQMGRANINDFVTLDSSGHIANIKKSEMEKRGHLVKRISSSRGKTDSISVEMYDAQTSMGMVGKHLKLFENKDETNLQTGDSRPFFLPADLIAPDFLNVYRDIKNKLHTEYVLKGGRGSTKSSFVSLAIIYLLINNPSTHALVLRQVKDTLRDSVFGQIKWAINELGLSDSFKCITSPLEIEYLPTKQKIYFRGADDPANIKSIKPTFGHIGFLWFEELDQFHGPEAVRNIMQSALRGGEEAFVFKSFNPPRTTASWVNKEVLIPKANRLIHHSSYLTVPPEWLGRPWIEEAEHLKEVNPKAYDHEYMGVPNGTGGQVFENVIIRKITDEEIAQFDHVLHGNDFGYYPDPWHYARCHYDVARLTLYVFGELRRYKASNRETYQAMVDYGLTPSDLLISDSAEPKSVADYREYGLSCRGAEKGPDSVGYSMKWLQSLKSIVIDNVRCPCTADEFLGYELEQDKNGEIISAYPDRGNHAIDAVRYATNLIWRRRGQ